MFFFFFFCVAKYVQRLIAHLIGGVRRGRREGSDLPGVTSDLATQDWDESKEKE